MNIKSKIFIKIISFFILIMFTLTSAPAIASSNAKPVKNQVKTTTKTSTKKPVAKKKISKKKVVKRKSVNLNPPLITLETAPHSEKPVAKKKTTKKAAKKKV